jgi:hypothetical protein
VWFSPKVKTLMEGIIKSRALRVVVVIARLHSARIGSYPHGFF